MLNCNRVVHYVVLVPPILHKAPSLSFFLPGGPNEARKPKNKDPSEFMKWDYVSSWLNMKKKFYEVQPDFREVHAPWAHRREAYEEYLAETRPSFGLDRRNEETGEVQQATWPDCHETYFYRVWDADHPDLKLRAYNRFMHCDTCLDFNDNIQKHQFNPDKRMIYEEAKRKHYDDVMSERMAYEGRILEARNYPKHFLSMVIDGSDNGEYGLPHFARKGHEDEKGHKQLFSLYGAIVHGHFTKCYTFSKRLEGGSNVTVNILDDLLKTLRKRNIKLPPKLCLQLDNTSKDNKNVGLLTYCRMLVETGVFKEISVHFLPVGHTHCDVGGYTLFANLFIYVCS
uniref:DUF7869 domain-containing protein n=1 Tax=Heterosigma akashiwo TaxID=2829 RepID=A0A7S4D9F0_HETAK